MPNFHFQIFKTIEAAGADWDLAAPPDNFFLQRQYLQTLENCPPDGMRFANVVFYKNKKPVGVGYCQIKHFKGDDHIQELNQTEKDPCFFTGLAQWFKKMVAGRVAADILICGNMLLTGEHGYHFDYQQITRERAVGLLEDSWQTIIKEMERGGVKMPVILVKDLLPTSTLHEQKLVERGFTKFEIQPNMALNLHWPNFEGYLAAMSTKYRTRAKRAFKKLDGIERRELSAEDIERELPRMYELYKDIARNAGFNMVDLNERYLLALKRDLPEHFRAFGLYFEGRLVAFFTVIKNGHELEAHFLGYDKTLNHDFQIYQNILYQIVQLGLEMGRKRIVFARTALEIKSTVGAEPEPLFCYLRHQNGFTNKFAGVLLDYLKPVEEWVQRHPFKQEHD